MNNNECVICLNEKEEIIQYQTEIVINPCCNTFACAPCMKTWNTNHKRCPYCRATSDIFYAIENCDMTSFKKIIKIFTDGDLNTKDKDGSTALMMASLHGNTESTKLLIEAGADLNLCDSDGVTALMIASLHGNTESIKLLIEAGTDLNLQTKDGYTALMMASRRNIAESVKLLTEAGADFNISDKDGYTALMIAYRNQYTDIIQIIAKANIKDNQVGTASG